MADIASIKVYAGFLMNEVDGLCDKLSKARGYYATMLSDGANLLDDEGFLDNVEEYINNIEKGIYSIMRLINLYVDDLPQDKEKEGEEDGGEEEN